jgi:hypothetical protein
LFVISSALGDREEGAEERRGRGRERERRERPYCLSPTLSKKIKTCLIYFPPSKYANMDRVSDLSNGYTVSKNSESFFGIPEI